MADIRHSQDLKGLALPALAIAGRSYFQTKVGVDVGFGDLILALFCPLGGWWMHRSRGSRLKRVLFEPNIDENLQLIQSIVEETAARTVPHVTILNVAAFRSGRSAKLEISFALTRDVQTTATSRLIEVTGDGQIKILGEGKAA